MPNKLFAIGSIDFKSLNQLIHNNKHCGISYNPSKQAAIVNPDCGSAVYINFATKHTYTIVGHWPNIAQEWLSNTIARVTGPCGTGCAKSVIFKAPATVVSCATHEYRLHHLSPNEPPDYYNNRPLLIDVKRGIYVCYDDANKIQVFPLPVYASIKPPKHYAATAATIRHNKLVISYENVHGKRKDVAYGDL